MRILYVDIDTLRPDHLGCYGYPRNTSPNIDRIAAQGVRFEKCYVSDAPCLPSRASMFTGVFGIRSGVVGHGGTAADLRIEGTGRGFSSRGSQRAGLIMTLRNAMQEQGKDLYTVSFSPFAERHAAWWWYEGWREMHNTGKSGGESAEEIVPLAIDWVDRNGKNDDWLLHVNIWDPHTDYRAPEEFGNPFEDQPLAGWYSEQIRQRQWDDFGPGTPQEPCGSYGTAESPRQPRQIRSMDDYTKWVDGYDCGIAYADLWIGRLFEALEAQGVLDETVILITSDHGENMGELNVIGDHATADHITSRVPMILRWPGIGDGPRVDRGLYNQCDIGATLVELVGATAPAHWDAIGFAEDFRAGRDGGRDYAVFSQNAWSCQRSVRWDDWVLIRTYHTGLKHYRRYMLFNVADDPHELNDLADDRPELVAHGLALIDDWHEREMKRNDTDVDPMWTVIREGGPFHTRTRLEDYCRRLRDTGRGEHADFLEAHPDGLAG